MSTNQSIRDFFQPKASSVTINVAKDPPRLPECQPSPSNFKIPPIPRPQSKGALLLKSQMGQSNSATNNATEHISSSSSSLSPPPCTDPQSIPAEGATPVIPPSSDEPPRRVIKGSDDEDDDSDSSLEDLSTIFASRSSNTRPSGSGRAPSTPNSLRHQQNTYKFQVSPLAVHTKKYKFDLSTLASHAANDNAIEESSKRVKALMEPQNDTQPTLSPCEEGSDKTKFAFDALLETVVARKEDGGMHRVSRALKRTEATVTEKRWYFFETSNLASKPKRRAFPTRSVPQTWKAELVDPQMRYHSFVSGYAEDLVELGRTLPDELFLWILDEACLEVQDALRFSYFNTLRRSLEQVSRLIVPSLLEDLFFRLEATSNAIAVTRKIRPADMLPKPYSNRNWASLSSFVKFVGQVAKSLQHNARVYAACILLRMSMDHIVVEDLDLFHPVQETMKHLCSCMPDEMWDSWCTEIGQTLFESVEWPTLRLQIVNCLPSTSLRLHDLRRRLAMCFFFDEGSYAKNHPYNTMDMDLFMNRLEDEDFDTTPQTDYSEFTALVKLLDIAIDDGRSAELDLTDKNVEARFNEDVDTLVAAIKKIMTSIGNPGAAFISRIEAKEELELVSQRISDTVRSKPKPKHLWFDRNRVPSKDSLEREKKGMSRFLTRTKDMENVVNGQTTQ